MSKQNFRGTKTAFTEIPTYIQTGSIKAGFKYKYQSKKEIGVYFTLYIESQ